MVRNNEEGETANGIHRSNQVATDVLATGIHSINHIAADSPQQVKQIFWCNQQNRYTQQISQPVTSLKLEIETNHSVDLSYTGNMV